MDFIAWFVPPSLRADARKNTRHRGIAKSLLAISLVVSLMFLASLAVRGRLPTAEYLLFAVAIGTPTLGAMLIRATGDITLGLVTTNFGGILILAVWAFLTGGMASMALPVFLANIALLGTFGNAAILLIMGATMMAVLVFLYLATSLGWLPASMVAASDMPELMLTTMLGSVGLVVFAGVFVARDRAIVKLHLRTAQHAAEQSSRAKSVFLTAMSDELRRPLNTILGFAEQLAADQAKTLSDEQRRCADHIANAGEYLLRLVTQALEMSRIESDELQPAMEIVAVERIIASCLSITELEARNKNIAVVNECGALLKWHIWADLVLAEKVLLNLLSNAVKFSPVGGQVVISCQPVGAEYLRINISDSGCGVSGDKLGELFQPFARLGAAPGVVQGAGLGLAIAKRLTERMRGRIGYEPNEGQGSTFWVALPLAEAVTLGRR